MRTMLRSGALVDAWFDMLQPDQKDTAHALRDAVMAAAPDLTLSVKWGNLVFSREGTHIVAIVTHKDSAHLQVFNGMALTDQFPELEGHGKGLRYLRLRYRYPLDEELVREVVQASLNNTSGPP
jgi:uncharacterized protein YdhG (YjbR/CyaY superfamily)